MARKLPPLHPGEILREEFLIPLKMSPGKLAAICHVPRTRIERLVNGETGVTADTALRLGRALKTSAQLWMNLQNTYDVKTAELAIGRDLAAIEPIADIGNAA
jgi:addiction module HigA family antidote